MKRILILGLVLSSLHVMSQENFPVNGVADERPTSYAFTNATIFRDYQTKLEGATLLIKDGRVVNSGVGIAIPAGAQVVDLKGMKVVPCS